MRSAYFSHSWTGVPFKRRLYRAPSGGLAARLGEVAGGARLLVRGKPVRAEVAWNGATIITDGLRLRQILHNLVTNAARAPTEGAISIGAPPHGDRCRFTVTDTGGGIPRERQDQIFTASEQVDAGSVEGIGRGLAMARQLAEVMGGEVTVHSAPGRGAAFIVDLPASAVRWSNPAQKATGAGLVATALH
ncbi:MAG: ATP-binding protein [Candidatus Binatia bacterium]|nr:ATP-binding protein [Candidatus Binatia bacterium]